MGGGTQREIRFIMAKTNPAVTRLQDKSTVIACSLIVLMSSEVVISRGGDAEAIPSGMPFMRSWYTHNILGYITKFHPSV